MEWPVSIKKLKIRQKGILLFKLELNTKMQNIFIFLMSMLYSFGIVKTGVIANHVITVIYISFLVFIFLLNLNEIRPTLKKSIALSLCMSLGIIVGFFAANGSHEILWLQDAHNEHLPKSIEVKNFLSNINKEGLLRMIRGYYRTSHFLTGAFFLISQTAIMSTISMFLFKFLTGVVIYSFGRKIFSERVAFIASLFYIFSPSIIFYSLTFYKDAAVQFWFIYTLFTFYLVTEEKKYNYIPFFLFSFFCLGMERNYVAVTLLPSFLLFLFFLGKGNRLLKLILAISSSTTFYFIFTKYLNFVTLDNLTEFFINYRRGYHNYAYMDQTFNSELGYFPSWVKLYFTPFFTPGKFKLFFDYSILLTWGSFVHQVTMLFFTIGFVKFSKVNMKKTIFYILPFFFFMCAFAYISSYSGRVRNSYYGIIVIFAAYGLMEAVIPWLKIKYLKYKTRP